jgi:polyhydroxybutyrate depolymerase
MRRLLTHRAWTLAALLAMQGAAAAAQGRGAPAGLAGRKWTIDGVERSGLVAEPKKPIPEAGSPLVLIFHGHGGTSANSARSFGVHAEWPEAVVVYLQGLPTPGRLTDPEGRLPGWQSAPGEMGDRDLELVDTVLAWAKKAHRIDAKRIYAGGHSNGASFTYVLWAARGDQFAAFAPSSAVFSRMIASAKPKPALIVAGERDALVPFAAQMRSLTAVRRLNQVDTAGTDWSTHARLYKSKTGADLVAYIHPGGHALPRDVAALATRFFKAH